jgi:hypothetical protein
MLFERVRNEGVERTGADRRLILVVVMLCSGWLCASLWCLRCLSSLPSALAADVAFAVQEPHVAPAVSLVARQLPAVTRSAAHPSMQESVRARDQRALGDASDERRNIE